LIVHILYELFHFGQALNLKVVHAISILLLLTASLLDGHTTKLL